MKLLEWMVKENVDDSAMAEKIGDCTAHAVKKWKYGEREPGADVILRIEQITKGKVALKDWVSLAHEGADAR